jgi:predicted DNA-binding transcriptional regulator AlpA
MHPQSITFNELPEAVYETREEIRELKQLVQAHLKTFTGANTSGADELLTPEETAGFLKVSKVTVWDWSKRGILYPHRIGNQVRYLRSEILAATIKKGGRKP